ncbi:aspartyl/asparaginyl beta-hydroxylase domain-containing protein [Streptomyces huiliensis]|uniref:aspartyl/asparaginyl beta-hydroxylase domain-containing protein n=1 Tax=Streptomyces huiliensis TaxID=2876027 RepID=UPI001CBB935A|nr:aspartyl/asparaginyl beta-hydroxylase domain-containing protein [Streptomyces huiliensis]MBZ4319227.1 aspartyl/asparaginyl beta-hydroxylase domain-containing protein [Streptomyces huiliensis]
MTSFILGKVDFDEVRLAADVAALRDLEKGKEAYDEFTSGFWKNVPLWNESGDARDGMFKDVDSPAKPTEHTAAVPYLTEVIGETFAVEHLTMVRGRDIVDASMMPHKDFLELDGKATDQFRVLMVLEDNEATFNSDEEKVFRMRKGEVWFLDAAGVHCAANFSADSRVSLCLDFSFDKPFVPADVFASSDRYIPGLEPLLIKRKPLPDGFAVDMRRIAAACTRHNFRDIAFGLAKLHFTYDVPAADCYEWLVEIAECTDDAAIVAKAERAKDFYVVDRAMHERFSFTAW